MDARTWQVTADVVFPNHFPADTDDEGKPQLPKQLTPKSRIPTAHREIDGVDVFIYEGASSRSLMFATTSGSRWASSWFGSTRTPRIPSLPL